jgi:hypothetical protein
MPGSTPQDRRNYPWSFEDGSKTSVWIGLTPLPTLEDQEPLSPGG